MTDILVGMGIATFISLMLTPAVRELGKRSGFLDTPHHRKMHREPIPRTGGIAIFLATLFPLILMLPLTRETQGLFCGLTILAVLGIVDDARGLSASTKAPFQALAAWMLVVFGGVKVMYLDVPGVDVLHLPEWFSNIFTILCVVAVINAVNLIDGLDGLAGGIASIVFGSVLVLAMSIGATFLAVTCAIFLGAILGFLWFNRHPATVFMGDTGSMLLGLAMAYVTIKVVFVQPHSISTWVPVSLLALPVFDTVWAILRRLLQGKSPMAPDRSHVHHRLVRIGFSHAGAVHTLWGVALLLCVQAVLLAGNGQALGALTVTTVAVFYLMIRWMQTSSLRTVRARTVLRERLRRNSDR